MKPTLFEMSRREFAATAAVLASPGRLRAASEFVLADWKAWPSKECAVAGATAAPGADGWLALRTHPGKGRAGLTLKPAAGSWSLEAFAQVAAPVRNTSAENVRVILRLDDGSTPKPAAPRLSAYAFEAVVPPGPEPFWLVVSIGDRKPAPLESQMISLVAPPPEFVRRGGVDGAHITSLSLYVPDPTSAQSIAIGPVVARGAVAPMRHAPRERVFPFIDEYGQFIHRDWPGKIHRDSDFAERRKREQSDLVRRARPASWSRFGGWAAGPRREATGFFRVEKIDGVWWMVDPEGRLFWSHGVVRVGTRVRVGGVYRGTPLPDREHYFRLPPRNSPLAQFYATEPQSTRGYYLGKDNHAVYDYLEANLFRKFGSDWVAAYAEHSQRRLASWGLNTIANSSDPAVYLRRKTPYTAIVYSAPMGSNEFRIAGSRGNWGKLPDPFDPGWRRLMERTLHTELKESLDDPWCLGFFVDNELHWGDSCHLAEATLASPASQPAKRAFVEELRKKYPTAQALNAAWGTKHESWQALLDAETIPDRKVAAVRAELEAWSAQLLDAYFRGCREAVRAAAPRHMYLGCRFAGYDNALVMGAAARYCDVVSINRYSRTIHDLALPAGLDRPIVIGEFHFGALDSAPFGVALVTTANQVDRARAYCAYVESALRNPVVVGTHWFQYYDQPTSGRFDGENYNAGLADICDTPYPEMIAACRKMGHVLYEVRARSRAR
jgi:hypothetical protein